METREDNRKKWAVRLLWAVTGAYGAMCLYLFYMQSVQPLDYDNRYFQSDLPYHISMIVDDGWYYSFTAYIYQLLHWMAGGGTWLIALFLAAVTVLCILLTERLLRWLLRQKGTDGLTLSCALGLNLVMPFFWPYAGQYRYVSYQSGNIWHNSTYQCMKLAALAVMILALNAACAACGLGSILGIGEEPVWSDLLKYHGMQLLMQLEIGGICFGLSSLLRRSSYGLAIGAAMGLYFLGIFINMDTSLEPLRFVTPYYYAEAARVFAGEPLADAIAVGCGLGVLGAAFGLWRYAGKDIAA